MNGQVLCLWLTLFALLLESGMAQDEDVVTTEAPTLATERLPHDEPTSETPAETAVETDTESAPEHAVDEPLASVAPEPQATLEPSTETATESAAEPEPQSEPAAELESKSTMQPEPEPEVAVEALPEATAQTAAASAHDMDGDLAATAAATMAPNVDYQNDAAATPELPSQSHSSEAPTTQPKTSLEVIMNCYSCSSYPKGKCDQKPSGEMSCPASSKEGCYTLIKSDTKLIMRGCISELSEEGDRYCRKESRHCKLCYDKLCNKDAAPPASASAVQILSNSVWWILCVLWLMLL
ncbi:hypothetical protein KR093_005460 [Drosophila rubida]|uniref:DUF753 domain-containing protein n=1 Tax=Drosophila rubida TaxID=30044 RepID=A0AAD4K5F9_9MUSC|nr:hypothetical protein KR093_005460 [Drosophila rubida]